MKTINTLRQLINVFYFSLITVAVGTILFFSTLYFFTESLPIYLQGYAMLFQFFSWKIHLVPITTGINFMLFIIAIHALRRCTSSFTESDFHTAVVIKHLKSAGSLFIFIGVSTILVLCISAIHTLGITHNISQLNAFIPFLIDVAAAIDLKSTFLIIIGLFFVLFSKSFKHANRLKQENDLTI